MTPGVPPLGLDEAIRALVGGVVVPPPETCGVDSDAAIGRVLAADIVADRDLPPFDRATMDGIAVRASDARLGAIVRIEGELAAGQGPIGRPPPGSAIRIATGAAVPAGLDAVVAREGLETLEDEAGESVRVLVDGVRPGRSIHPRGVDARAGDRLVPAGCRIDPIVVALAATTGVVDLPVRRRPRIGVLTTGDELRPIEVRLDDPESASLIRNGNAPMLSATIRTLGAVPGPSAHVGDDLAATEQALGALLDEADLVLSVGGVSAGDRDFVPRAASRLGLAVGGRGVRVQPGRPFSWWNEDDRLRLVGLPGNPVSAFVCTHLLVRPWIDATLGLASNPTWTPRRLAAEARPNPDRTACRPARFGLDDQGRATARVAEWNGSGDLPHLRGTHGLVRLPEQRSPLPVGTIVDTLDWRDMPDLRGIAP